MASATPLSSASGSGGLPADVAALFETFAGKPQAPIKFYEKNAASKHSHVAHGVLHCSNAAQMTWMRPPTFQTCCWGRSTRRPALSEPMKLPQRPASGAGRSSASGPPDGPPLTPLALFLRQLRPFHQGCSSKCTKARGGCKRRREPSWRQLEQRAGRHDSRASASAPTAAADGRKVLSGDRGGTCSGQDGFSGAQDRNMTVLGAAGAPSSRKNRRCAPHDTCIIKINTGFL